MIKIKCETVGEKRKVSVQDGDSLVYMIEAPLSGEVSELKLDIALLTKTRNDLRNRQAEVDTAIITKLMWLGAKI